MPLKYKQEMSIILQEECWISFFGSQERESIACNFQSLPGHLSFQLLRVLISFSALLQFSAVYSAGGWSPDIQYPDTQYLSSISLCAEEDETLQLLVNRLHTLRF